MEENKYLRVTDIIKRLCAPLPPDVELMSKKKGEIGTSVHSLIDDTLTGAPLFYVEGSREHAYLQSWSDWYIQHRSPLLLQEQRFYCDELMITGQVDAVMLYDGMPVLVDYKTSSAEGKLADGSSSWAMQAHFYHYLLQQNCVQVSDKMLFVQLKDCKEITCITNCITESSTEIIRPTELSQMIAEFSDEDKKIIHDKLNTIGEFEYTYVNNLNIEEKRKIIIKYTHKKAKVFEYTYDKNIASRCIEDAKKAWIEISEK